MTLIEKIDVSSDSRNNPKNESYTRICVDYKLNNLHEGWFPCMYIPEDWFVCLQFTWKLYCMFIFTWELMFVCM